MLLPKPVKTLPKLRCYACSIQYIQEYPGKVVVCFDRNLKLDIAFNEKGHEVLCKLGGLGGLTGEFKIKDLLGLSYKLHVFNNQITKITKNE